MDQKASVTRAFSRVSSSYSRHAEIQKEIALELYRKLDPLPTGDWLEIGCGTGFLTRHLLPIAPSVLYANDISSLMLETLPNDHKIIKLQGDAETMKLPDQLGLIASSFALQWFSNTNWGLRRLAKQLKKGGKMVVSLPLSGSFQEWKDWVSSQQIPLTLNRLPKAEELLIEGFRSHLEVKTFSLEFDHPMAFLSWFKEVGANVSLGKERMPVSFLRELAKNKSPFKTGVKVGFLEVLHV